MARYHHYDYDQLMLVPVSLEEQLTPGILEYAIHHIVEHRLDLSFFDERYCNDETGRKAIDPKLLVKIILLGYSRGMLSSRSIERACRENITFMALACGKSPDHSTIAAFASSIFDQIDELFARVLLICEQDGLLGGTHFSLDGLKLPSNAAKEWSGTFPDLEKKHQALKRKVKEAVREHRNADKKDKGKSNTDNKRRQSRIKQLRQKADRIEKFLAEKEPKIGSTGKEIQSNVTDNDSAKLASSHGVVQGYNANAVVDDEHQVVVHAEVFGKSADSTSMAPMLDGARKRWFSVEDFKLDDRTGKLICPAGQGLYVKNRNFTTADGMKAIAYQAPKTACRNCKLRSKCLRNPKTVSRQVHLFYGQRPGSITDEMKRKIDTPKGRKIYSKRLGIVEPVFGNIRACKKMDRFTLRGRNKVNIQWLLYCIVHNIEKICNYGKTYAMQPC